jgi:hypothetical protein
MTIDEFHTLAWRDFILFAFAEEDIRIAFTRATGVPLPLPAATPVQAMVDAATGAGGDVLEQFVEWVTRNLWGIDEAPVAYQQHLKHREEASMRAAANAAASTTGNG